MHQLSTILPAGLHRITWCYLLLLLLALPGLAGAQSAAPAWQLALSGVNNNPTGVLVAYASAADTQGNIFITGSFSGAVVLGGTQLTTAFPNTITDMFVAKWDATAQAFTWATSGGGMGSDEGHGIAVSGPNIYVTGNFQSGTSASFAGYPLAGTDISDDIFVAKYIDTSTGHTSATSSFVNAWATSGGGRGRDYGTAIAVTGTSVFITGYFTSASNTRIAGQALTGAGSTDIFVAKYNDTSTGSTPATSSFANGWATSGGGLNEDAGTSIAVSGTSVFITGRFYTTSNASIAGQPLPGAASFNTDLFVAKYIDTSTGSTPATSSFANGWATSGGGTGDEVGNGIAVRGNGVFVTGDLSGAPVTIAGQQLTSPGSMFVAKYVDTSTGNTPATSSFANGWVTGGSGRGFAIAVSGVNVFVTGSFSSGIPATIAGQTLSGAGGVDIFVAKYLDTSTGTTPATSSFTNGWAVSAGGAYVDAGFGIALSGQQIYAVGTIFPPATFGSIVLSAASVGQVNFIGRLLDTSLTPLPVRTGTVAGAFRLYPNPARGVTTLSGLAVGQVVQVYDAMGRSVHTTKVGVGGTVDVPLTTLPAGVYIVRVDYQAQRLTVE